jgi:glycosyltransferase involved in cell wall biosynthesis
VLSCSQRGYGAALAHGILEACGEYVIFADCDGTYIYEDLVTICDEVHWR